MQANSTDTGRASRADGCGPGQNHGNGKGGRDQACGRGRGPSDGGWSRNPNHDPSKPHTTLILQIPMSG
eukprot:scaffold6701_cov181-Amphora_coffeaeformis.AAC.2